MDAFSAASLSLALCAALIYVVLRFMAADPASRANTTGVSRHALWTAVIAFFASGTSGLSNLWATAEGNLADATGFEHLAVHAAAPGFWLGAVYLIGQYTWPRHLQPVRTASLEVRSAKKVVPRYLAGVLLLVTLLSSITIAAAWNDAGAPSRTGYDSGAWSSVEGPESGGLDDSGQPFLQGFAGETDQFGNPVDADGNILSADQIDQLRADGEMISLPGIDGTGPGSVVGPYLAGGLGLVLASVAGITILVIRRPPLQTLDAEENNILRRVWINRLLRTAVIVVSGFGAMSLQYLAQGMDARAAWGLSADSRGTGEGRAESLAGWLVNANGIWMIVAVIAMAAWAPPRLSFLDPAVGPGTAWHSLAYSNARDLLFLAQGISVALVIVMVILPSGLSTRGSSSWEIVNENGEEVHKLISSTGPGRLEELASLAGALALLALGYFLIQALAAHGVSRRLGTGARPAVVRSSLLPAWFIATIGCGTAAGLASIVVFAMEAPPEIAPAAWWFLGAMILAGLLAWALHRMACTRGALAGASRGEDRRIRILVAHRGARVFGGVGLLVASSLANLDYWASSSLSYSDHIAADVGPSAIQVVALVLGLVLCFLPASTAMRGSRDGSPSQSPSMSGSGH